MKKINTLLILSLGIIFISANFSNKNEDAYAVFKKVFSVSNNIKSMEFTMNKSERIDGKMMPQKVYTKYTRNPLKIYTKQMSGAQKDIEVLFRKGWNGNKALIKPNGFPWMNVSFNPYASTMRKGQHHTLYDIGYNLFIPIMEYSFNKHGEKIKSMVTNKGTRTFDGRQVWEMEVINTNFKWIDYVVKKGETLLTIAAKDRLSEYMIMMKNDGVDSYTDVRVGQTIKVPTEYAKRFILYIDQERYIPLVIKAYDEKGLFEDYNFTNVKVNPTFTDEDFSKDNKNYGF